MRTIRQLLAALAVVLGGFATSSTAAGAPLTGVDISAAAPGTFAWTDLGHPSELVISTSPGANVSREWTFNVDGNTAQPIWWYGQLVGKVRIERDSKSNGNGYLWASVNDRTFASIKYSVDGLNPVRTSSVDYAQSTETTSNAEVLDINFRNVLQNGSIAAGPVTVRVWLEVIGDPGTFTATIAPSSSFEATEVSPFPLRLASGTQRAAGAGLAVPFRLSSVDGNKSHDVFVQVTAVDPTLTVRSPAELLTFDDLGVDQQFEVVVDLDPQADGGQFEVLVVGGRPNEMISSTFNVTRTDRAQSIGLISRLIAAGILGCGLALVIYDRLTSERRLKPIDHNGTAT